MKRGKGVLPVLEGVGQDRRAFLRLGGLGLLGQAALGAVGPVGALGVREWRRVDRAAGMEGRVQGAAGTQGLGVVPGAEAAGSGSGGAPGAGGAGSGVGRQLGFLVNALGNLENPNVEGEGIGVGIDARAIRDAKASGLTAINVTLGYVSGGQEPFEFTVGTIGEWDRFLREREGDFLRVWRAADIRRARESGRVGVIYGFQNGAAVGEKVERVDVFGNLGVRVFQLTYNPRNQLGDGSMVAENRGLTELGRKVVARLNENRMMVDLSHSGEQTCLEAARVSKQPISINHTGCRALADLPRNKTDEELRLVASRGGFVGIYFMPFLTLSGHARASDVVAHIAHAVDVCGEDHVGIGTDGTVTPIDDLEAFKSELAKEVAARAAAGIGAKGERADTLPFVVDLRGVDQFRELARLLEQRGFSTSRIEKILGLNFLRFAEEVWGS